MPDPKFITVPPADELLTRLRAIDGEPHMDVFYRLLLDAADREQMGMGIANRLVFAWNDYSTGYPAVVSQVVAVRLHAFVPAFTDDPEVQAEALDHLKAIGLPDGRD